MSGSSGITSDYRGNESMKKLTPISHREMINRLRRLGFTGPMSGGKHLYMVRNRRAYTIPNPHAGDIGVELLRRLLRQWGVTVVEWNRAGRR